MRTCESRGQLNGSHDGFVASTENLAQNWTLDATGNWSEFKQGSVQGTWTIDQDRTHDAANQLGAISGTGGWASAQHDAAGNMTIMPDGNDPANYKLRCTYDAWNRLVNQGRAAAEQRVHRLGCGGRVPARGARIGLAGSCPHWAARSRIHRTPPNGWIR